MKREKVDSVLISGVHASYWAAFTVFGTFLVTYLSANGYSPSRVGLIVSTSAIVSAVFQPLWGYLSDTKISIKKVVQGCLVVSVPIALLFPTFVNSFTIIVILNALLAMIERPVAGLLDTITNISAENNKYVIYGVARGCGSLFSAVATLFIGDLLNRYGLDKMFLVYGILLLISFTFLTLFSSANLKREKKEKNDSFKYIMIKLVKNKAFVSLLISNVLLNIGLKAALTYMPVMVNNFGGDVSKVGLAMAVNTVGMLPMMIIYSYLQKKGVSNVKLFIAAAIFTVVRILSMSFVTTVDGLVYVQILNSLSYGFLQPSMINAIGSVVSIEHRATAITLASSLILGVSSFFGDFIAGGLVGAIGMQKMFILFTLVAIIGMITFVPFAKLQKTYKEVR